MCNLSVNITSLYVRTYLYVCMYVCNVYLCTYMFRVPCILSVYAHMWYVVWATSKEKAVHMYLIMYLSLYILLIVCSSACAEGETW